MRLVATIHKAHCYFRINGFNGDFLGRVITPFCKHHLYKIGKVPIPGSRQTGWKVTHVFARSNYARDEFRIPASLLPDFISFARQQGYNDSRIKLLNETELVGKPVKFTFKPGYENMREGQAEWVNYQLAPGAIKVNNASTGYGKLQPLYSAIKVPGGWSTMGKMKIGTRVVAPDGSITRVNGVYPQGIKAVYRVHFEDGRYTDAGLEHLWKVKDQEWKVITTQELMQLKDRDVFVPLIKSENTPPSLSKESYNGSTEQRLKLLKEILDKNKYSVFTTCYLNTSIPLSKVSINSKQKCIDTQYLIRSLGGIASLVDKDVYFYLPYSWEGVYTEGLELKVDKIEYLGEMKTQCISVEHADHLYITDGFTVTHNTYMGLRTMLEMGVRTLITIQPRYITTWIQALSDILDLKPEDVLLWEFGLEKLPKVLENPNVNPKVIIITMTRIDVYLRNEKKDHTIPPLDTIINQLGCGLRLIDEGHESIHQVCTSLFYGNFPKLLLLSATLTADDPFINKMYRVLFPFNIRLKEPEPENYIDIVAYLYDISPYKYNLKTQQFGSYNDLTWEESILSNKEITKFYFSVAKKAYEDYYLDVKEEGTKCLFFFSRVNMCMKMLEMFQQEYPGGDFATFTGEDTKVKETKTKYLNHEVVITTPGSCGTGKDIPGLVTVISFHMVSSTQRNKQMIGRLRDIAKKFGGKITPRFVFPMCVSQPKHKEYCKKREVAFEPKKKTFKVIDSFCELN